MIDTSKIPLQSFDPRYREILLRGSREHFDIPCGTESRAHRLQMMLCQFRSRMKKAHLDEPEMWQPLYDCVVGKSPRNKSILHLYPRHDEFSDILDSLSVEPPSVSDDLLEQLAKDVKE